MYIVTTTGTAATVTLNDLDTLKVLVHPVVDYDLELEFTVLDLSTSQDLQNALNQGWIILKDEQGNLTTSVSSGDIREDEKDDIIELIEAYSGPSAAPYFAYSRSTTFMTTDVTNAYTTYISLTPTLPALGEYKLEWSYTWSHDSSSSDFVSRITVNGTSIMEHIQEPKDSAGSGNGGTDQRHLAQGFDVLSLSGTPTIVLEFKTSKKNNDASIHRGILAIGKV